MQKFNVLEKCPLFMGMNSVDIELALSQVITMQNKYKKKSLLKTRGEAIEELSIILEGMVKAEMLDYTGKAVEIASLGASMPIAPAFVFGKKNVYPVNVISLTDVTLLTIPKASLVGIIKNHDRILTNYLNMISNKVQFLTERIWAFSFNTIREKLAHYILDILKPSEDKVKITKTQRELSEYFGVSRPSLARVIGEMQKENIIEFNRKEIFILNKKKLIKILSK